MLKCRMLWFDSVFQKDTHSVIIKHILERISRQNARNYKTEYVSSCILILNIGIGHIIKAFIKWILMRYVCLYLPILGDAENYRGNHHLKEKAKLLWAYYDGIE